MARHPRVFVPGYPHHVVQLGHDRKAVFVEPGDYAYYLANLAEFKVHYDVAVYAWFVMADIDDDEQELIRTAVRRNQLTGRGRFVDENEQRTGLRIEARGPGRPQKQ